MRQADQYAGAICHVCAIGTQVLSSISVQSKIPVIKGASLLKVIEYSSMSTKRVLQ